MGKYSEFLYAIYECYASTPNEVRNGLLAYFENFDAIFEDLPFEQNDAITSARNALCAKFEETAFLDGFRAGVGFMLELLQYSPNHRKISRP